MTIKTDKIDFFEKDKKDFLNLLREDVSWKVKEDNKGNFYIYPKFISVFPFNEKRATLDFYYGIYFENNFLIIKYFITNQIKFGILISLSIFFLSSVISFFYPKIFGVLFLSVLMSLIFLFKLIVSYFKASSYIKKKIKNII